MMTDFWCGSTCRLAVLVSGILLLAWPTSLLGAEPSDDHNQWLAAHNSYRALHGVPPVLWSEDLAASSRTYAESCPSGHSDTDYGENLSWASSFMSPQIIVGKWYAEEANYDYDHPGYVKGTGHFSQIVWKGTRFIGCAWVSGCSAEHSLRANTWVCHYSPAGNYVSQFEENVPVPLPSH